MKKLASILTILAVAGCGGEAEKAPEAPSIHGTWQLHSVTGEELTESEKSATMTFNADGSCEQKRGERAKTGTFELSEDGKKLTITRGGKKEPTSDVVKLDATTLVIKQGSDEITFKRK